MDQATRDELESVTNEFLTELENHGAEELPWNGGRDAMEDLDMTEFELFINHMYSKGRRARRTIGSI